MSANRIFCLIAATAIFGIIFPLHPATPGALSAPGSDLGPGKQLYEAHCAACHGATGTGDGPASVWLFPKPRNFAAGLFKIQSTPPGSMPTDDDLFQTVTRGMPGSSMPSFAYLGSQERQEIVQYIKYLTAKEEGGTRVNLFADAIKAGRQKPPVSVPPEPGMTLEALVTGKEIYTKLQCFTCHGEHGVGDGPSAATLKDNFGFPLWPRDFTLGAFRGGSEGRDLYLRIANGLAGTPMPPFDDTVLKPAERWALVQYIQSLRRKEAEVRDILKPEDVNVQVKRVSKLLTDPVDPGWERLDITVRVPLNPLWPEPYPVEAVAVSAVHDGKRIAILCQWKDAVPMGAPVRVQDFQDGMALQFSLKGTMPFLGMGDRANPVNLWYWRAGWQQEMDGERPDVATRFASMHVDTYFQPERRFVTARDAGNILALPHTKSPVEDANAYGFGTLKSQPAKGQNVQGKGLWRDGFWNVVFLRELRSREAEDVKFSPSAAVPVAFAVWNGEQRDRNGRKVISNWFKLILDP